MKMAQYIPEELIPEILWRLPVDSIVKFGYVCKSWYSLIRNPNFISTHLYKSKNTQFFLHQFDHPNPNHPANELSLRFPNRDTLLFRLPTDPFFTMSVINSFNGIICLVDVQCKYRFTLCNPSIRHSIALPIPKFVAFSGILVHLLGFGFDDTIHDYKIVRILKCDKYWAAEIYSLNSNCWRDINIGSFPNCYMIYKHTAAFVNGGLHWLVGDLRTDIMNYILVFDLKDERFHRILLPECLTSLRYNAAYLKVHEFEESSIVVTQMPENIRGKSYSWVMREYGVVESWEALKTGEVVKSLCGGSAKCEKEFVNMLPVYDKGISVYLHKYVPSLLLLDKGNTLC